MTSTEELKATDDALTEVRARHSQWSIWISDAGRYWATRRSAVRLIGHACPRWAMTVDADSLMELETRIKEQEEYGHE